MKENLIDRIRANFPQELIGLDQWVVWRIESRDGKPTKIPYNAQTGGRADSTARGTWGSFEATCRAHLHGNYNGVGFVFSENDPYAGVDFDRCIHAGVIDPDRAEKINALASYTETSQSGTGVHIIVRGVIPGERRKSVQHDIEMYDSNRFFVVTGDLLPTCPKTVSNRQKQLKELYDELFPAREEKPRAEAKPINLDDRELLEKMSKSKAGAEIQALWRGDLGGHNNDHSAGDLALCCHLAFWTGRDEQRIDQLFRQSALYRDKWDRKDYRERTIKQAISRTHEVYTPRASSNGYHAPTEAPEWSAAPPIVDSQPAKRPTARRTYPDLLAEMKDKATSEYNEYFVTECLFNGEEGDARLLDSILKNNVTYDHAEGLWYWFNDLYWEPDQTWNIYQLTSDILSDVYKHLSVRKHAESIEMEKALLTKDEPSAEESEALKRITTTSKSAKARSIKLNEINEVKRILNFACSGLRLGIKGEEWDTKINLLAVENGIIDLITGELVQPVPSAYIRTVAPVVFDPSAKCPRWEKSLLEIFDGNQGSVDYVQRVLGYAMSGACVESDFPIWFGKDGRNGKEFILERVRNVLGDKLAGVVESELLLASKSMRSKNSSTEGLMALRGRRIAWATETNEGRSLDLASMKDLSGGHILTGRHNHGRQVEWKRTHTLILLTNHRPHLNSQALAEWDRVKLLEFPLSFVNDPDPEKPNQRKKDKALGEKIDQTELPGVFNWLLEGCIAWRLGGLDEPESVKKATAAYQQDEDTLGDFIKEVCVLGEDVRCKPVDLYRQYVFWVDVGSKPMGKKTFYSKIEERGYRRTAIVGFEWFVGIGVKEQ